MGQTDGREVHLRVLKSLAPSAPVISMPSTRGIGGNLVSQVDALFPLFIQHQKLARNNVEAITFQILA